MLTTSWAALTEHTVSEQCIGHWGGMPGKRSHLRERAGVADSGSMLRAPRLSPL